MQNDLNDNLEDTYYEINNSIRETMESFADNIRNSIGNVSMGFRHLSSEDKLLEPEITDPEEVSVVVEHINKTINSIWAITGYKNHKDSDNSIENLLMDLQLDLLKITGYNYTRLSEKYVILNLKEFNDMLIKILQAKTLFEAEDIQFK